MLCTSLLAATLLAFAAAKKKEPELPSPLLARLCQDQMCNDAKFPMIDYDERTGKCHCSAHPCWSDGDKLHQCQDTKFPHILFSYTKQGKLECGCSAEPHYMSKYIAQVKCPGEHCEGKDTPMLDYDDVSGKCFCRAHPCISVDGFEHSCNDAKFPILHYREEKKDGKVKQVCECKEIMKVKDEL